MSHDKHAVVEGVVARAQEAFWQVVAEAFPTTSTGDFAPEASFAFDEACRYAVEHWLDVNETVSLAEIAAILRTEYGLPSYVEQTGGGIATVYVQYDPETERSKCLIGPGWFEGHNDALAAVSEACYGADDDGEGAAVYLNDVARVEGEALERTVARLVAEFVGGAE